jgi:hypothetical protein
MVDLTKTPLAWGGPIRKAAFGDCSELAWLLRSDLPLDAHTRNRLADLLEGKLKRKRGRPKRPSWITRSMSVSPLQIATHYADRYRTVWRKRYGLRNTLVRQDGSKTRLVAEACRKGVERLERRTGRPTAIDPADVEALLRRPKSRR